MKMIAVIPARGGSKRFPKKNIVDFFGKPLIAYTIQAALETGLFEKVTVSTDDKEIATISEAFGALVTMRPPELATDQARVHDVCLNLLDQEQGLGLVYDILCCLYATAPLRTANDIRETVRIVQSGASSFALAVTNFHFPPHQALIEDNAKNLVPMWPDLADKQSQSIPVMLCDNGSTYVVSVTEFRRQKTFLGTNMKGYMMPRVRSVDIDVADDLEIARLYARGAGW